MTTRKEIKANVLLLPVCFARDKLYIKSSLLIDLFDIYALVRYRTSGIFLLL